jgi:hypothetical protein
MSGAGRPLDEILERARWAPSGDNRQSFRFTIVADDHVLVHGFDTRHDCVYDLDGSSSQIALGAWIETMAIAASVHGLRIEAVRRPGSPDDAPLIDARLIADTTVRADALARAIESRSVNRRPLKTRPLTAVEHAALDAAVGSDHRVVWREGAAARRRLAGLLFRSARIRLTMHEAYLVHRDAIEWGTRFSEDRVPDAAVGLDPMTLRLMRWAMRSWDRVRFLNRFAAGTWTPRLQLDLLPSLLCAGHFLLVSKRGASSIDDFIAAGRALQRFWLTAASLGLQLQPELTPLIFARYHRGRRRFSSDAGKVDDAGEIARRLDREFGADAAAAVFLGRVGAGDPAKARSLRLPLPRLMMP